MTLAIRLLLVEDSAADAELIVRTLARASVNCTVERVETAAALEKALTQFHPDIVLSDFSMPGFSGMQALAQVRRAHPHLPFVFVSGTIGEDVAIEALKHGATDYVLKSNLSRLAAAVERALTESATVLARVAAEDALRNNEQRLRDIVETSQDWIWELDENRRCTFSSGAVRRILGYEPQEILGSRFEDLLHPDSDGRLPTGTEGDAAVNGVRARWLHRDGTPRWLERSAIALCIDGQIKGYRGTERDVTRRLHHENRIERLSRIHLLLSSVNGAVARSGDRAQMMQEVSRLAVEHGGYLRTIVAVVNSPDAHNVRPVAWSSKLTEPLASLTWPLSAVHGGDTQSLVATALTTRRAAVCDDLAQTMPTRLRHQPELLQIGVRAIAVVPMVVDDKAIGVISFESRDPGMFDAEELGLLADVAEDVAFSLHYHDKVEAVRFLSWFDPLTQLARRELFCERLGRELVAAPEATATALVVDLERLGFVNDSMGREIGDELIRAAADRMRTQLGNPDRLAHFGGGTFAIALTGIDGSGPGLERIRDQVRDLFGRPFVVGGQEIDVSIHCGLAHFPEDARDGTTLVQNAEAALRRAKESGVSDFNYTVTINAQLAERLLTGQKLNRALDLDQFVLHYQPLINIDQGRVVCVEALLRWQDPDRGLVPPNLFIPLLEESGQIVEVGQWVFEQAARDARRLHAAGIDGLRIAVNISPLQLRRADFVKNLKAIDFDRVGDDSILEVEITESMLMQDLEGSIAKLAQLRKSGIRISIDDFGTGYSSLALLARLPIDNLKIDRSFISTLADDPASMTVVSTIIGLARSFRLNVVAEGVETDEQLKLLRLMKCDVAQGFHFGRPVPLEELIVKLTAGSTSVIRKIS